MIHAKLGRFSGWGGQDIWNRDELSLICQIHIRGMNHRATNRTYTRDKLAYRLKMRHCETEIYHVIIIIAFAQHTYSTHFKATILAVLLVAIFWTDCKAFCATGNFSFSKAVWAHRQTRLWIGRFVLSDSPPSTSILPLDFSATRSILRIASSSLPWCMATLNKAKSDRGLSGCNFAASVADLNAWKRLGFYKSRDSHHGWRHG